MKGRPAKLQEVTQWLKAYLSQGSRPYEEIARAASAMEFSSRTLKRAKAEAGIESVRRGTAFFWKDPDVAEDAVNANLVQAIQNLAQAINRLARRQPGLEPVTVQPLLVQPGSTQPNLLGEIWSDEDYRTTARDDVEDRVAELTQDLAEAQKYHGRTVPAAGRNDAYVIDNYPKMQQLKQEIDRANQWLQKRFPDKPRTTKGPFD